MGEEEVSLALSGMSSGDYVFQDSINLSTSSLFKGRGDFPSRRCLAEWLVKIRIRFLLLLLPSLLLAPSLSLFLSAFYSLHFPPFLFPPRLFQLLLSLLASRHHRLSSNGCNGFLFSVYSPRRPAFHRVASSKHPRFATPLHPLEIGRFR